MCCAVIGGDRVACHVLFAYRFILKCLSGFRCMNISFSVVSCNLYMHSECCIVRIGLRFLDVVIVKFLNGAIKLCGGSV